MESTLKSRSQSQTSNCDEPEDTNEEYMDMQQAHAAHEQEVTEAEGVSLFASDSEDVLNSTEVDDLTLSGYVQDNFDFLDQMDCSIMDCSVSNQANEFSVEPPGHYDEEYEVMDQPRLRPSPLTPPTPDIAPPFSPKASPTSPLAPPTGVSPPRLLTVDHCKRHTKSLSLPYMTSPVQCPSGSSSDEDVPSEDSDVCRYNTSSEEEDEDEDDESMFVKSLPSDFFLNNLPNEELEANNIKGLQCASLEEKEQKLVGRQASEEAQEDVTAAEEDVPFQSNEVTDKDSEKEEFETVVIQEDKKQVQETLGRFEEERPELSESENKEEDKDVLCQTDESTDMTSQNEESEAKGMQKDEISEEQFNQEVIKEQKREDERHENQESEQNCEPEDGTDTEMDQDNLLLQATDETDSEDVISLNDVPLYQGELETDDGHFDSAMGKVCQEMERVEPSESDEDAVVIMLQDQAGDEETFEHEINNEQAHTDCSENRIWDELEDVVCEVIEDLETDAADAEIPADVVQENETKPCETKEFLDTNVNNVENETMDQFDTNNKLEDGHFEQECHQEEVLEFVTVDANASAIDEKHCLLPQSEAATEIPLDNDIQSVGSKVVMSKLPRVYQVKAVPIVPPKPQHCKMTVQTLREQQLRERAREDRAVHGTEGEEQVSAASRAPERWREGEEGARPGPQSMCFDEAVAIATLRRGRARESERERLKDTE